MAGTLNRPARVLAFVAACMLATAPLQGAGTGEAAAGPRQAVAVDSVWSRFIAHPPGAGIPRAPQPAPLVRTVPPRASGTTAPAWSFGPDIPLHPDPGTSQSELSIAVHPGNGDILLAGSNAASLDVEVGSQGWYLTTDDGTSWSGGDTLPTHIDLGRYMTDPAVAIDLDGNFFFAAIEFADDADFFIARSTDLGATWTKAIVPNATVAEDKDHFAIDVSPASPFAGNLYGAYTDFGMASAPVVFSRSTDHGDHFSAPAVISDSIGSAFAQGVNLAVGPEGQLYATWSGYDNFPPDSTRVGFNRSTDGGATWQGARGLGWVHDLRGRLAKGNASIRVNSYPSMAVDRSPGPRHGWIYLVYAEKAPDKPDVRLLRSTDGGDTWTGPVTVNQDSSGNDQWFPWIAVDATTGALYVVYYDSRNFAPNDSAEVYVSTSVDGGTTFEDFAVSDVPFLPTPIPDLAAGYMGDYIGVAAGEGVAWPAWNDDRTGVHQAYTKRMAFFDLTASVHLVAEPLALDFDTVFVGYPAARQLELRNIGFPDTLLITGIEVGDPAFTVDPDPFALPAGMGRRLEVRFDAALPGDHAAEILISSSDPARPTVSIPVRAVAAAAPALEVSADSLSDSLAVGEEALQSIWLRNTGGSDLDFSFTVASPVPARVLSGPSARSAGRAWKRASVKARPGEDSDTGAAIEIAPRLAFTAMDSTLPLVLADPVGDGGAVDLAALRGRTRFGALTVRLEFAAPFDPANFGGFLSLDLDRNAATGAAPSFGLPGQDIGAEFELSFFNLAAGYVDLALAVSGDSIASYPAAVDSLAIEFVVPLADLNDDDGYMNVTGVVGDGLGPTDWFPESGHGEIRGPDWLTVDPAAGTVAPGESLAVVVRFAATELYAGRYARDLVVASDDPERPAVHIPAVLRVTGVPDLAVASALDFDAVYVGFPSVRALQVANAGTDTLHIAAVESSPGAFTALPTELVLPPGHSAAVTVTCLAETTGPITGTLTLSSDDPDQPELQVGLAAVAAEAPAVSLAPDTLTLFVRVGDSTQGRIAIGNAGPGLLAWQLVEPAGGGGGVFSVAPVSGTVGSGESDSLFVQVVASSLSDGPHWFMLRLATNDPRRPEAEATVLAQVEGIARGDADANFQIDARDIIMIVNFIFRDGPPVHPVGGDPNCDGGITLADVFLLVDYVFKSAPAPLCP